MVALICLLYLVSWVAYQRQLATDVRFHTGMIGWDSVEVAAEKLFIWPKMGIVGNYGYSEPPPRLVYDASTSQYFLQGKLQRIRLPLEDNAYRENLSRCVGKIVNATVVLATNFWGENNITDIHHILTETEWGTEEPPVLCYAEITSQLHPDAKVCVLETPYSRHCVWTDKDKVPDGSFVAG